MSLIQNPLPQVALHRLIQEGIAYLKKNPDTLDVILNYYLSEPMNVDYGESYLSTVKQWLVETKIPVVQAWSANPQQVPQISVQLVADAEDEGKAAIGDHWGMGSDDNIGTAPFITQLDVALQASKGTDQVLWLYEMTKFILFKFKRRAEQLGLQLHTFSASDVRRNNQVLPDNVYVRYIRVRTITQTFWNADALAEIDDLEVDLRASPLNRSEDVDI